MTDFNVSISELKPQSNEFEQLRVVNKIRGQTLLRFEANAYGTSDGAGTWLTLWHGTVPRDCKFSVDSIVSGAGSTGAFSARLSVGLQDIAGTVSVIGGTSQVIWEREDVAAMDMQYDLAGSVLSVQVRDDGTVPMTWKVFVEAVGTAT